MSDLTNIEWADSTFNPWEGCTKVGPGCDHCYAENRNARYAGGESINWGVGAPRRRTSESNWKKPIAWNNNAAAFFAEHGRRQRVFCASLADVFDNEVNPEWRRDLFDLIELTPNLNWLLLTKRIGNVFDIVSEAKAHDWIDGHKNVWLGITVVNQQEADRDIPKLLSIPAEVRFLSIEPLLGKINIKWSLSHRLDIAAGFIERGHFSPGLELLRRIDWVIVGGESGVNARPMHINWLTSLRDQCFEAGVPFLFKQWGEFAPTKRTMAEVAKSGVKHTGVYFSEDQIYPIAIVDRVGKKAAGRELDGLTHNGFPRWVK